MRETTAKQPSPLGTTKETFGMSKTRRSLAALVGALFGLLVLFPASSASADSAWWQVLTGSRPTNLWIPKSEIQEIQAPDTLFGLLVGGEFAGAFNLPGVFPEATAANVQAALETIYGPGNVEVTGGPGGVAPLIVKSVGADAGKPVTPIETIEEKGSARVIQRGGSGSLVLTITNLGDAPVDGTSTPVKIIDELPEGVEAFEVEGFAGFKNKFGPMDCTVESPSLVSCSFEGTLPSYEALEVEIPVSLTGEPPVAGTPGTVTVSGGNAPSVTTSQEIKVDPAPTPFGYEFFESRTEEEGGARAERAGTHPFQFTNTIQLNSGPLLNRQDGTEQPAQPRNVRFIMPAGLVGNLTALQQCSMADFYAIQTTFVNLCSDESAIGVSSVTVAGLLGLFRLAVPLFNLPPAPGEPARFGFTVAGAPIVIDTAVDPDDEYRLLASVSNTSQLIQFLGSTVTVWGTPGDPSHDDARGWGCGYSPLELPCVPPVNMSQVPFLRQPVTCSSPMAFGAQLEPWNTPLGSQVEESSFAEGPLSGCNQIPFTPELALDTTSSQAGGASGLNVELQMPNAGLEAADEIAEGQAKKVEVTLPEGVTVNPSQAEGLAACSPADYARETAESAPGAGCPEASKIGSIDLTTPLLDEGAKGSVYVAKPYDNPFNSLLALYLVAKIPDRGVLIKQAGKVTLNPSTGQLVTTFDDLPQIPFDTFNLHFFGGNRAPLVLPSQCGTYNMVAKFTPWHASDPDNPQPGEVIEKTSSFTVDQGLNGKPCPSGTPPFNPDFKAGTSNNAAGSYSPLNIQLTREDDEQEFSRFSVKLPKGLLAKLAGIPFCPDAAIAAARARTGPNGGQEELDNPSCPAASQLGRTLVGAGVGPELTYAPGKIYLAGPYQGAKLSIVAIATAKVGPFDLGNVVIRQALRIDPETAEVTSDGSSSDPIPHILQGIVVHARDIRVFIDRDNFVLNPTSCAKMTAAATVLGGGGATANVNAPFQAADCASLGFKPNLTIQLLGGTTRTATPRLKAVLTARKGDANIGRAQVTLPPSEFLEQNHIRTVCTRVQFNAGGGNGEQCPKASIYGKAKAISPLLDEPLKGPVFLRSSDHELPDMVAALHSPKADINLVGRIDSTKQGGIRSTFEGVPDAPVSKFILQMQGGKKGLIVNSEDICKAKHRAKAAFKGQNGKRHEFSPVVKTKCGGKKGGKGKRH
jgi:hypothetical protein